LNSSPRLSRKEQEKQARKRDILEAAARLFAMHGFHDVKVDDIAEAVGLSKGTIYLYFENKDNLFFSMLSERLEALDQKLSQALHVEDHFLKQLRQFVLTYLGFFRENESFYKIVHSEKTRMSMESHYKLHEYGKNTYIKLFDLIVKLAAQGIANGELRPADPKDLSLSLVGILNMFIYNNVFQGATDTVEDEAEKIIQLFLHGASN